MSSSSDPPEDSWPDIPDLMSLSPAGTHGSQDSATPLVPTTDLHGTQGAVSLLPLHTSTLADLGPVSLSDGTQAVLATATPLPLPIDTQNSVSGDRCETGVKEYETVGFPPRGGLPMNPWNVLSTQRLFCPDLELNLISHHITTKFTYLQSTRLHCCNFGTYHAIS